MSIAAHHRPICKLPPPADKAPPPAKGSGSEYPCPDPEGPEQYLSDYAEWRRLRLLEDTRIRWAQKAREATTEGSYTYAANRAAALARPLQPRMRQCGRVIYEIACGNRSAKPILLHRPCRQWWVCKRCRLRRSHALRGRITSAMSAAWAAATAGGVRAAIRLTTFTVRHVGTLADRRRAVADGWRRFYKAVHAWLGRFPYVATWEVTPGDDGYGHPHLHLAWIGPRFVPYGRMLAIWRWAVRDPGAVLHHAGNRKHGAGNTAHGIANYLAKYLSKGVELSNFTDDLRSEVVAAFYNAHLVLTSHKFWVRKTCDCCGERFRRWYGSGGVLASDRQPPTPVGIGGAESRSGGDPPRLL